MFPATLVATLCFVLQKWLFAIGVSCRAFSFSPLTTVARCSQIVVFLCVYLASGDSAQLHGVDGCSIIPVSYVHHHNHFTPPFVILVVIRWIAVVGFVSGASLERASLPLPSLA